MLHDVSRMEEVLSAAVDAGATHIHGVVFQTSKLREYRDKARALAVQAAKDKAQDFGEKTKQAGSEASRHVQNE